MNSARTPAILEDLPVLENLEEVQVEDFGNSVDDDSDEDEIESESDEENGNNVDDGNAMSEANEDNEDNTDDNSDTDNDSDIDNNSDTGDIDNAEINNDDIDSNGHGEDESDDEQDDFVDATEIIKEEEVHTENEERNDNRYFNVNTENMNEEEKLNAQIELHKVFSDALKANNVELIEEILNEKPDIANAKEVISCSYLSSGFTTRESFIFLAIEHCDINIFRKFVRAGCELKSHLTSGDGRNALHRAVFFEKLDIIKLILFVRCIDINSTNSYGDTPVHDACYHDKVESLKMLLKYDPDLTILNRQVRTCKDIVRLFGLQKNLFMKILQEYEEEKERIAEFEEIRQTERKLIQKKLEIRLKNKEKKLEAMEDVTEKKTDVEKQIENYENEILEIKSKIQNSKKELEKLSEEVDQYSILKEEIRDLKSKIINVKWRINHPRPKYPADNSKNNSLIDDTDCPICCCALKPPLKIYQCSEGHYFCEKCKRNKAMENCAECREDLRGKNIRCRVLENLMLKRFEDFENI